MSSSLAQSGGYFSELDISLSPIYKTPTSALQAAHVPNTGPQDVVVKYDKPRKRKMTFATVKDAKRR